MFPIINIILLTVFERSEDRGISREVDTIRPAPGGHLLPGRCNFTNEEPSVALDKILSCESKCDRVVQGNKVELCLYNGCEQIYVVLNVYSTAGTSCENKGKYAIEYQFNASDVTNSGIPVIRRHAKAIGNESSSTPNTLAAPMLNLAAAGLEEPEPHAKLDDLTHLNSMLRQADQSLSVRVHVVRAVAAMVDNPTPADCDAFIDSGCFDVFCATIANAAALGPQEIDLMFSPGAPERDICHSAVRSVFKACQVSNNALERAWRAGTATHLSQLASSLRIQSHVRHRELLREVMEALASLSASAAITDISRVRRVDGMNALLADSFDPSDNRLITAVRSLKTTLNQ